jgi:hypothetical protein
LATVVFVSYSRRNAATVDTLVSDAESLGFSTWVDRKLSGGQQWWDEVLRAIRECDVFLYALSSESLDSSACQSEYSYATALGKPILPVLVSASIAESLVPKELSELQRVDYAGQDKAALSALARGLNSMPPAGTLPEPLPAEPELAATYWFDLKAEIDKREPMSAEEQGQVLDQLQERLVEGHDPAALGQLLDHLEHRDDLLVKTAQAIALMQGQLDGPGEERVTSEPRIDEPPPRREAAAAAPQPDDVLTPEPAAAVPADAVNGAWWIAPIVFGIIGGVVAWLANKDKNATTARNMLITGIVIGVVYLILFASGA